MKRGGAIMAGVLLLTVALAGHVSAQGGEFEVRPGEYLWNVWNSPQVKQEYPDWRVYLGKVSELNNIPATDEAWEGLPSGRKIKLPGASIVSAVSDSTIKALKSTVVALEARVKKFQIDSVARVAEVTRGPQVVPSSLTSFWIGLGAVAFIALVVVIFLILQLRQTRHELKLAEEREKANAVAVKFAEEKGLKWYLPPDIRRTDDVIFQVVYFLRDGIVEGEPTVRVAGIPDPIMVKNLKKRIGRASDEVLKMNGLVRTGYPNAETLETKVGSTKPTLAMEV